MKVLFIGDASNFHNTLAHALTDMGHTCVVASDGSGWQKTDRDIDTTRQPGKWGTIKFSFKLLHTLSQMRGFDVVHIISPHFLLLRPSKLKKILDFIKRHNKLVIYSASNTEYAYIQTCLDGNTFRYSDFRIGNKPSPYVLSEEWERHNHWNNNYTINYFKHFINSMDGIMACLYEYYMSYKGCSTPLSYAGIPIDTKVLQPHFIDDTPPKVKFFIGIQKAKNILKGADRLLDALKRVCERYPDQCEMTVAENVPYKDYVQMMNSSHVILDQFYSYTPATNALIAMAQGMVAVSGAEPEYYDFIGEKDNHPIINVSPLIENDIYNKLEWLIQHKHELPRLSHMSREFVEKHNDSHIVAQRHIDFWNKLSKK